MLRYAPVVDLCVPVLLKELQQQAVVMSPGLTIQMTVEYMME
jgi:hypothetical protein